MSKTIYARFLTDTIIFVYTHITMNNYYKQISELPMLEDTTNASRDDLVLSHLRLVPSIVNKTYRFDHPLYDDLVQAGNIALMTAAKNYDPTKGVKFGSYAIPYIQMCVMNYVIENTNDIRVLNQKAIRKAYFNRRKYKNADGCLDRERMASELKIRVEDIREMEERIAKSYVSIHQSDTGDDSLVFDVPDYDSNPERIIQSLEFEDFIRTDIKDALSILTDRERFIVENRHITEETLTLQEIAPIFGVSVERIRQIEKTALKKLCNKLAAKFETVKE